MLAVEWSLHDRTEELELEPITFPCEVRNRHREKKSVSTTEELIRHCDCDERFNLIQNLLAARFGENYTINPESLITTDTRHMLNLYATQRRFGMCYLFKSVSDCPIGVQICFDIIASKAEEAERNAYRPKRKDNGNSTSRTHRKN